MTQLIAAICESGKAVVTASDRMVSSSDMTLTFEQEQRKAERITDKAVMLIAGTMHEPDLIRDVQEKAKGKERIRDIAEVAKELYQDLRDKHILDELVRPRTGLKSFEEYHKMQKTLHDSLMIDLNEEISEYHLKLSLLLVGMDEQAHIIRIDRPGTWRSSDMVGFCTIGMGDRHAGNVFAWYRYSTKLSLQEAAYIAFEAKKRAEMAGGVGAITDMLVINERGCKIIKPCVIDSLGEIYNDREKERKRGISDQKVKKLDIQTDAFESP